MFDQCPHNSQKWLWLWAEALRKQEPSTAEAQLAVVKKTCRILADISCKGYEMAVIHGNSLQVGNITLSQETAEKINPKLRQCSFDVCDAMSQGYIGYQIQQCLRDALRNRNHNLQ